MADNSTTPATGLAVASDDIGSVQFQRIKLVHGADGTNAGDVSTTNGLPIDTRYVGGTAVNAHPAGFQRVSDEPSQLFYDPFESLDSTDRWTATTAGGGQAAAVSGGRMTLGSGTTINGYAYITSQPTFTPPIPGWLGDSFLLKLESAVGNNAVRFWGLGLVSGSVPSSTNPLGTTGNGIGFEVTTAGVLNAVLYSAGTRTLINALASNQPADALDHRYIIVYRTDRTDFYIDGLGAAQLVATSSISQSPAVQVLSTILLSVAHSSAPAASRVLDCAGLAVWDTAKNNKTLSDGKFGWRRQTVLKASTAAAATDFPAVVAFHPSSPIPQNALTKGTQGATGITTQDLKDAGRNARIFMLDAYTAAPVAEAMQSVVQWYGNAAVAATVSPAVVPAGKTLRLQTWALYTKSLATVGSAVVRVRVNTAGTAVIGSPLAYSFEAGSVAGATTVAMTGGLGQTSGNFPDGFEIPAAAGVGFSLAGYGPTGTLTLEGVTRFVVAGFEY